MVTKLKLPKNNFNKEFAPKLTFFDEKKNQKDSGDFFSAKITFESPILALPKKAAKLGKASQDAYNW